ncbi:MAG: hypothetical protein ACN4E2_06525 [Nitrospinota bacterium]
MKYLIIVVIMVLVAPVFGCSSLDAESKAKPRLLVDICRDRVSTGSATSAQCESAMSYGKVK